MFSLLIQCILCFYQFVNKPLMHFATSPCDSLSTLQLLHLRVSSLPTHFPHSTISLDQCLSSQEHAHTQTHIHPHPLSMSRGRLSVFEVLSVCLLWSEPSKFPFIGSSVTDFSLQDIVSLCGCVNYSKTETKRHFDLQHSQLSKCASTHNKLYRQGGVKQKKLLCSSTLFLF